VEDPIKRPPVGIQTFGDLEPNNCIYVDKTAYLAGMIANSNVKAWFLSRPRRFGKSLTVSTLECLFSETDRRLFTGLQAENFLSHDRMYPRPVIRLDMSEVAVSQGIERFESSLRWVTANVASLMGIELDSSLGSANTFGSLIQNSSLKSNKQVAVLIDEYDAPLIESMNRPDNESVRATLREYFKQLKVMSKYISFIFITGITKFSKMGIFSALNNLRDITIDPKFGAIVGFTQEELEKNFSYLSKKQPLPTTQTTRQRWTKLKTTTTGSVLMGKPAFTIPSQRTCSSIQLPKILEIIGLNPEHPNMSRNISMTGT
jgi:hypothetical protein